VYGARGSNFLLTIRRLARERPELRVVDDQVGSPTWCRWVAEATAEILLRISLEDGSSFASKMDGYKGLYNLNSEGEVSWFGFARAILEADPVRNEHRICSILPIKTEDYPTAAKRPYYSVLSKEKIRRVFHLRIPSWHEQFEVFTQSQG
jgi:dTDP-4-dehydrorhamnose reductase